MKSEKLAVSSTRFNLKTLENKLKSIERGHSLLKCKSDALQIYFKQIDDQVKNKWNEITQMFQNAFDSLSEAKYLDADVDKFKAFCLTSPICIDMSIEQRFGIEIHSYKIIKSNIKTNERWRGGYNLNKVKSNFDSLLNMLVEYASEKKLYDILKANLETTNKRKNALEHNLIPSFKATTKYIEDEMDELEREEFYRLKKVQSKKYN
jgi:V-type H+-transporting ATPase subunit D